MDAIRRSCLLKLALFSINECRNVQYNFLKPLQSKTLISALKSDVIAVLPTGYGKSLIFECLPVFYGLSNPHLHTKTGIIVISPLNSIILEQVVRYGDRVIEISSKFLQELKDNKSLCTKACHCSPAIQSFAEGRFSFLIGHPEGFLTKDMFFFLRNPTNQEKITHIVVDEAHCVDKWGVEFRKDFSKLQELRSILPNAKVLALTATASRKTQDTIKSSLNMGKPGIIQTCVIRPNIKLTVNRRPNYTKGSEDSFRVVMEPYIQELKEKKDNFPKSIVYCGLKWCGSGYEECQRHLSRDEMDRLVRQYHSPCTNKMREEVLASMGENGDTRLLFATEAYSMGTDSPNIRRIIHFGVPKSIESYLQEVGRAGRDGEQAEAMMFFNNNDIAKNVVGLEGCMADYCRQTTCRWDFMCNHFGCLPDFKREEHHSCCDNCEQKCSCSECVSTNTDEINTDEVISKTGLVSVLLQYFQAENSLIASSNPAFVTGLSADVAEQISFCKTRGINEKFSYLGKTYLENIIAITKMFDNLMNK